MQRAAAGGCAPFEPRELNFARMLADCVVAASSSIKWGVWLAAQGCMNQNAAAGWRLREVTRREAFTADARQLRYHAGSHSKAAPTRPAVRTERPRPSGARGGEGDAHAVPAVCSRGRHGS